jgi:glycosyltransferase involved in cell wall biosynthesis
VHLAALVESPTHVCCRYRFAAFRPLLTAAGHRFDLISFPRSLWGRFRLGSDLSHLDAVILQRRLLPGWLLDRLRRRVRRLFFDLDDAIYLRDSHHPRGMHDPGRSRRFAAVCRASDGIIAGNGFLGDEARRQGASVVHVIPTCVDPAAYPIAEHRDRHPVQLVWIGSSSTLKGLKQIAPLLEHIGRNCPGVRLKLVCNEFLRLEHLPIDAVQWSEECEADELASADVGIAWVPDDDWSRGKCGLKVLQYMAAGLPVVANPVGVQGHMVRHGETGFLASSSADWVNAVATLARDPGLRQRMGAAGRRRVEREYSVAAGAALWRGIIEETGCLPSAS